ncbi:uncharacterized protein LOC131604456 [Vicia villosa]|uniref:uncharacterized protein LOC131604456 n=1 Tax=Vicia villosa TaxID=3911 RepID=UPI00273B102E|nr:uncharacterized protein LOC131604456 [Vicia villosa]
MSIVEEKVTPHSPVGKGCSQCDVATSSSDYSECNLCCKHHRSVKNDLLAPQVNDKKKHIFGVSTRLCKHFVGGLETTNMNKKILLTFRHDPVFSLVYHFHKQQHLQRAKMTLNRSESFPFPYSLSRRKERLYTDNETKKPVLFVSSKTACEQVMPSVAKAKVNGNFNMNEAFIIVKDVKFSSVSAKGQNSLKQKIENVTGERGKEKIRVAMDSVIHKLPQGQRLSDRLKNEILKKLKEPIIKREVQRKNSIRRTVSLQEPLESYCKTLESSFKTEARASQSEKLKLEKQRSHSPLRMLIPLQRILSLPDLQSFSYTSQKGDFSDFTPENQIIIDKNDLVISNILKSSGSISKSVSTDKPNNVAQKTEIRTNKLTYEIPQIHVDTKLKDEFNYVKYVLEISGFTTNDSTSAWHSRDTPLDPSLYEEMENDPEFCGKVSGECNHHVLFDLINETMLEIYGRSYGYLPSSIVGCHVLHKVWTLMSKSLCLGYKVGQKIDDHVSRDLARNDGWVNIQFYDECFGLEVDHMIFHDLLKEIVLDLALL